MSEAEEATYVDPRKSRRNNSSKDVDAGFALFLSLSMLSIALLVILTYQLALTSTRKAALDQQLLLMQKQEQQASLFKASLQSIINDLRQLGQTDPDAQAIVRKYITVQQPQTGAQAPAAPAPSE